MLQFKLFIVLEASPSRVRGLGRIQIKNPDSSPYTRTVHVQALKIKPSRCTVRVLYSTGWKKTPNCKAAFKNGHLIRYCIVLTYMLFGNYAGTHSWSLSSTSCTNTLSCTALLLEIQIRTRLKSVRTWGSKFVKKKLYELRTSPRPG